jgi:hypothetical protein
MSMMVHLRIIGLIAVLCVSHCFANQYMNNNGNPGSMYDTRIDHREDGRDESSWDAINAIHEETNPIKSLEREQLYEAYNQLHTLAQVTQSNIVYYIFIRFCKFFASCFMHEDSLSYSCWIISLPHCLIASLPHCLIASLPHCLIASLPCCLIALLSFEHTNLQTCDRANVRTCVGFPETI